MDGTTVRVTSPVQLALTLPYLALLNLIVSSGFIFGFAGLASLLRDERSFREGCNEAHEEESCPSQDEQIAHIGTLAFTATSLSIILQGIALDRLGPRFTAFFGSTLFAFSLLALAWSTSLTPLTVSYSLAGCGSFGSYLATFQFANLFCRATLFRAALYALATASTLTLTVLRWLGLKGWERAQSFTVYAIISLVLAILALFLFPDVPFCKGDECSLPLFEWINGFVPIRQSKLMNDGKEDAENIVSGPEAAKESIKTALLEKDDRVEPELVQDNDDENMLPARTTYWEDLSHPRTIGMMVYFGFGLLICNWISATESIQLGLIHDNNGYYAGVFILIASLLPIPLAFVIDRVLTKTGFAGGVLISGLTISASLIPLLFDSLPLQILSFICSTLGRAFMLTIVFSFAAVNYSQDRYGKIIAAINFAAFLIGLLQLLMQNSTSAWSYRGVDIMASMVILFASLPYAIYLTTDRIPE